MEGSIPWTAIHLWAETHQLDEEQREDLFYHLTEMDSAYHKFRAKQTKGATPSGSKKGKRGGG